MKQINMQHNAVLYDSLNNSYQRSLLIILRNPEIMNSPGQLLLSSIHTILIDWTRTS
jgi:hypothetical protein